MHDKMLLFPRGSWETRLPFESRGGQRYYYGALRNARFVGLHPVRVVPALFEVEHDVWELYLCCVRGPQAFAAYAARHCGDDAYLEMVAMLCAPP